jgi:hypothetical protein
VRAALVGCDNVDQFIDQFRHHQPPPPAAISDLFTLIDIGAQASFSAATAANCKVHHPLKKCPSVKSKSDIEFGFYNEMQEFSEMRVACQRATAGVHDELTTSDAFVGIVMLQLLPVSSLVAEDAEDSQEFRDRVLDAAQDLESAAEIGLTTALAGDCHSDNAFQVLQSLFCKSYNE